MRKIDAKEIIKTIAGNDIMPFARRTPWGDSSISSSYSNREITPQAIFILRGRRQSAQRKKGICMAY